MRKDRGDAGADSVAFDETHLPDAHTGDVRNCIPLSGLEDAGCHAEVAGAYAWFGFGLWHLLCAGFEAGRAQSKEKDRCHANYFHFFKAHPS